MNEVFRGGQRTIIETNKKWVVPNWNCPECKVGILDAAEIKYEESPRSLKNHKENEFDFDWVFGIAFGKLKCNLKECGEIISFVGKYSVGVSFEPDDQYGMTQEYCSEISPLYFYPPLSIIEIHKDYPPEIKKELHTAFTLYWCDQSACANKIRNAVEILLTKLKISRYNQKKQFIPLHFRIHKLSGKYSQDKGTLLALKIISNPGSHGNPVELIDLINAFEILEYMLLKTYANQDKRIKFIVKKYVKNKK